MSTSIGPNQSEDRTKSSLLGNRYCERTRRKPATNQLHPTLTELSARVPMAAFDGCRLILLDGKSDRVPIKASTVFTKIAARLA